MIKGFRKSTILVVLLSALFTLPLGVTYAQQQAPQFQSEQEAHKHCPQDTVVWVNTSTGVYHFKGQRWYGNTKEGAYECREEANKEGDRATRNGQ